ERVDEEVGMVVGRYPAGGHFFLGNHWNARRQRGQRSEDDQFGRPVSLGYRRRIPLRFNLEALSNNLEDRRARFTRRLGDAVDQAPIFAHQRGAIRIPPSRRTAAAFMYGSSIMKQASRAYSSACPSR